MPDLTFTPPNRYNVYQKVLEFKADSAYFDC